MFVNFFVATLIFLFSLDSLVAQNTPKINEVKARERLQFRLSMFIEYQTMRDYENLYELLEKEHKDAVSKQAFVDSYKNNDDEVLSLLLIKFVSEELGLLQPSNDFALIFGCGEYKKNKKKKYYESQVEAVYENDDWYFRSLIGASVGFGTPLKKCKMPKAEK
jgi:hypothetical protein